jgi:hypothetical protein
VWLRRGESGGTKKKQEAQQEQTHNRHQKPKQQRTWSPHDFWQSHEGDVVVLTPWGRGAQKLKKIAALFTTARRCNTKSL